MNCLNLIAHKQGNLDWVLNLNEKFLIYNKNKNYDEIYARLDVPDVGDENETFLRGVLENYYLLDDYKYLSFLNSNSFTKCSNIYSKLNEESENIIYLSDKNDFLNINFESEELFLFNKHILVFEQLIQQRKNHLKYTTSSIFLNTEHRVYEILYVLNFIGIPYHHLNYEWPVNSQYKIPTKYLKNKSLKWWETLFNFYWFCYNYLKWKDIEQIINAIWPLIFEYAEINEK